MAHGVAEALLNAPQVLGSLSLLFNPTGLVRSVRAGVADLIGLPLAALQNQSLAQARAAGGQGGDLRPGCCQCELPGRCLRLLASWACRLSTHSPTLPICPCPCPCPAQFISGVGLGSVSLVKHTLGALRCGPAALLPCCASRSRHARLPPPRCDSLCCLRLRVAAPPPSSQAALLLRPLPAGWTLSSISGFSQAFSRAVDSAVAIRSTSEPLRRPPAHLGHGLSQGVASLAGGVAAGLTGVVRAPMQGYSSGSGVLGGIGRGLLGAVGLPVRRVAWGQGGGRGQWWEQEHVCPPAAPPKCLPPTCLFMPCPPAPRLPSAAAPWSWWAL